MLLPFSYIHISALISQTMSIYVFHLDAFSKSLYTD